MGDSTPCQATNLFGNIFLMKIEYPPIFKPQTTISLLHHLFTFSPHSPLRPPPTPIFLHQHRSKTLSPFPPSSPTLPPQPHCLRSKNPATPIPRPLPLPPRDLAQHIQHLPFVHQLPQPFCQTPPSSFIFIFVFSTNLSKIPSPQPVQYPPQRLKSNTPLRRKSRSCQSR